MQNLLSFLPTPLFGALMILVGAGLSFGGVYLVHHFVPAEKLKDNNDVAGFIYSMLGVMYAVLLAFIVVVVWEQYRDVGQAVEQEADTLQSLVRLSQGLPDPTGQSLRNEVRRYAGLVINVEWDAMARGRPNEPAGGTLNILWQSARDINPQNEKENMLYSQVLDRLQDLNTSRRLRLVASRTNIPGVMWVLLIVGGIMTVGFTFFFGATHARLHALMTAMLAASIAFILFLILSLDAPFAGTFRVSPEPFARVVNLVDFANKK